MITGTIASSRKQSSSEVAACDEEIDGSEITVHGEPIRLARGQWNPPVLYSQDGQSDGTES